MSDYTIYPVSISPAPKNLRLKGHEFINFKRQDEPEKTRYILKPDWYKFFNIRFPRIAREMDLDDLIRYYWKKKFSENGINMSNWLDVENFYAFMKRSAVEELYEADREALRRALVITFRKQIGLPVRAWSPLYRSSKMIRKVKMNGRIKNLA